MATVNKDFKIKSGLVVEGTTGTIGGHDILTKKQADQDYIIGLIGGAATSANEANTVVLRDEDGSFSAEVITADGGFVGNVTGTVSDISNHDTDDLTEGTNNLYFQDNRAQTAVSNALGSGLGYGSEGAGNVFYVDTNVIATKQFATDEANSALTSAQGYADGKATDAYNNAVETASQDATTKANNAQDAAEDFATNADSVLYTTVTNDINNATSGVQDDLDAHTIATSGVHGVTGDVVGTTDSQTISNKTLGSDLAAGGYKVSGLAQPSANQDAATKSYVDTAVADLVGAAPELLDTLNELAEAIGDDADFIGTVNSAIGEKVAKAGDSMSGNLDFGGTNKVTSLAAPTNSGDAANKNYVDTEISNLDSAKQDNLEAGNGIVIDGNLIYVPTSIDSGISVTPSTVEIDRALVDTWYDASGAAATAQTAAQTFATNAINALDTDDIEEGTSHLYFTNQRAIDAVGGTIGDAIDALTTDDIEEGETNLYFEDARAKASAGDLLAGATTENVVITYTGGVLSITAENGVADSTTDDLTEGSTNKYFADQLALDAMSNATSVQVQKLDISWVRREEAAYASVATASTATVHSFGTNEGSVKYLVRVYNNNKSHVTEVLATTDSDNNVSVVEYGTIYTSENPLATVTVVWNASTSQYDLNVTTANNNSEVLVAATLLAYND